MISGGWDGDAFDGLDVIWQFDELHDFGIDCLFHNGFADSIYDLDGGILFNDSDLIFSVEDKIGPEGMVKVQIHFLLLLLHYLNYRMGIPYYKN